MADKLVLLILYVASGLLLVGLSVPLIQERIRPNSLYGFRVQKTLDAPQVWYAANKYAAQRLLWAGISFVVAALGLYFIPGLSLDTYALGCLAFFLVVFIVGLIQSVVYLHKL